MCGINGIYAYAGSGRIDADELLQTRDLMTARGPDGKGAWISDDSSLGFGHRRLAIIDISDAGAQPIVTADGKFVVTFNGEIYNYRELRKGLEAEGRVFRTSTDTEVLLHLYASIGEAMAQRLRGMFAFAIWDVERSSLFLARDPYGIKPLYYADDGAVFRFASQVKALAGGGGVDCTASAAGWAGFYLFGSVPEPYTTYEAVRSLPAGCTMRVTAQGAGAPTRYNSIAAGFCAQKSLAVVPAGDEQDIAHEVRAALLESVRYHMIADVPVGAFLSGGIDSGALVGLMRAVGQTDIQTLTLSFPEFEGSVSDEKAVAAEVARAYGTRHTNRVVTQAEFREDLPALLAAMDQPTIDGINTWFIAKAASELGLKVVISGLGGDELFGGYPSFRQIPRLVRWLAPLQAAPGLGRLLRRALIWVGTRRLGISGKAAGLLELGGSYPGAYLLRRGLFLPWEIETLMEPDLARRGLEELGVLDMIGCELGSGEQSEFSKVATLESALYMRNQLLRDADWASMAHSLEVRVPLVDRSLLNRLGGLPLGAPAYAQKKLLRVSPSQPLPESVYTRAKTGFTTPVGMWMASLPEARAGGAGVGPGQDHWSRTWARTIASMWPDGRVSV